MLTFDVIWLKFGVAIEHFSLGGGGGGGGIGRNVEKKNVVFHFLSNNIHNFYECLQWGSNKKL